MDTAGHLSEVSLNVADPERLASFYCDILGMRRLETGAGILLGYGGQGAHLALIPAAEGAAYSPARHDRYWKIAITLPDLDAAYAQLTGRGIAVSEPHQFHDIAYMAHLADPDGHTIELLQHTFAGKPKTRTGTPQQPLGGGAQIGLVTLRTDRITEELRHCQSTLGMRYLSRQRVAAYGFDLHFLGFGTDTPPDPDPNGLANREWLWQRPYTCLEFQCFDAETRIASKPADAIGAVSVTLQTPAKDTVTLR